MCVPLPQIPVAVGVDPSLPPLYYACLKYAPSDAFQHGARILTSPAICGIIPCILPQHTSRVYRQTKVVLIPVAANFKARLKRHPSPSHSWCR